MRETPVGDVFRDVRDDSRFGSQNGFRTDFKVSGDADLGGDGCIVADLGAAGDSGLGDNHAMLADDDVVAELG